MSNYSVTLKGIGIENFKAFGEYQYFDLAPITIITGPNNSGKSALVAALELLSKSDFYSCLEFHSAGLEIGELSQVVNKKSKSDSISFHLNFELYSRSRDKRFPDLREYIVGEDGPIRISDEEISKLYQKYIELCSCEMDLKFDIKEGKLTYISVNLKGENAFYLNLSEKSFFINYKLFATLHNFKGKLFADGKYERIPKWNKIEASFLERLNLPLELSEDIYPINGFSSSGHFLNDIKEMIHYYTLTNLSEHEDGWYSRFSDIVNKFDPERHLHFTYNEKFKELLKDIEADIVDILTISKNEIQSTCKLEAQRATKQRLFLYQEKNIPLTRDIIKAAEDNKNSNSNESGLEKYLKKWTGKEGFNLFDDYEFILIPGVGYRFEVETNGEKRELPDLGFGTRQVIPIILGLFNNRGVPFIIEEPESNLHPRLQSLLADLFVEVKIPYLQLTDIFDNPLIIETHSEYLIRKLQYLVAKQEISPESIAIHYIGEDTGKRRDIFKIQIDKHGILSQEFGSGFYDEALNLQIDLLRIKNAQLN